MSKILQSSQYIDKMSRSGAANYIITSSQVADAISEIMTERISGRKKKILSIFDEDRA
jgi:hypothetical protein